MAAGVGRAVRASAHIGRFPLQVEGALGALDRKDHGRWAVGNRKAACSCLAMGAGASSGRGRVVPLEYPDGGLLGGRTSGRRIEGLGQMDWEV